MRIFDEQNNVVADPDMSLGYLEEDRIFVEHHEAIEAVEEVGHFETIAEYPNGGKDVEWVVDVPKTDHKDAWDEYEDIMRYILFTAAELAEMRILELKQLLDETDYCVIKIAEGAATAEDYADMIADRRSWRAEINRLKDEITGENESN